MPRGEEVHGELISSDASTAAALSLFRDGSVTARTLDTSTERLAVSDVVLISGSALTVDVFFDANADGTVDAGERIVGGPVAANGGFALSFTTPHIGPKGITPKVKASGSGVIRCFVKGYIIRGG
jgi:hypothetical protein